MSARRAGTGPGVPGALIRLVVFAVGASMIALLLFNTLSNSLGSGTASYTATFSDASGLRGGDNVRVAGVRVGRVDDVSLDGTMAKVRFTVTAEQPLLASTDVAIRYQNLIGQRFLALVPGGGSSAVVAPGSEIPRSNTENALDLTVVLNGFQPLFEVLSPQDINRLSSSIVAVLQGESGSISSLLRTTAQLSTRLADRDELIGRVITNLSTVLTEVGERDGQVDALIGELRSLSKAAAADRKSIGTSIQAISGLTDATTDLLRDIRPQLATDLAKLERVTGTFAREREPFAKAVQGLPVALSAFARSMQYGSWTNIYICNLVIAPPGEKPREVANTGLSSQVCA